MKKVLNFDKFISEKENETIEVTVYGRKYFIPAKIPAIVPVMMARAEDDPAAGTRMVMKAADVLFGQKAVNQMCENGMSATELADLVQRVFVLINGDDSDEDEDSEEYSDEDSRKTVGGSKGKK